MKKLTTMEEIKLFKEMLKIKDGMVEGNEVLKILNTIEAMIPFVRYCAREGINTRKLNSKEICKRVGVIE